MTPRQQEIKDFIALFIAKNGYAPTCREIGVELGVSGVTAHLHLKSMERAGEITKLAQSANGISLDGSIPLTRRQLACKQAIESGAKTLEQIANSLKVRKETAWEHVQKMLAKGAVKRDETGALVAA